MLTARFRRVAVDVQRLLIKLSLLSLRSLRSLLSLLPSLLFHARQKKRGSYFCKTAVTVECLNDVRLWAVTCLASYRCFCFCPTIVSCGWIGMGWNFA